MLWTLGVSWAWALNSLPTTAESAIIIVSLCLVVIVESVVICVFAGRSSAARQQQQRADSNANTSSDQQSDTDADRSITKATWAIAAATLVNAAIAVFQGYSIWGQWTELALDQRPWIHFEGLPQIVGPQI
jgi:hypothetical protein